MFRTDEFIKHLRMRYRIKNFLRLHDERELPFWTQNCMLCDLTEDSEWHHINYTSPLSVVKLCINCHRKIDGWKHNKLNRNPF